MHSSPRRSHPHALHRLGPFGVVPLVIAAAAFASCSLDRTGSLPADEGSGAASTGGTTTGPAGGGGTGGTVPVVCTSPDDCPGTDGACGQRTCEDGACSVDAAAAGSPCDEQGGVQCDGQGRCVTCLGAEDCAGRTCQDGVQTGGERCEDGACVVVPDTAPCAPYLCVGDRCGSDCTTTSHAGCVDSYHCDGSACVEDLDQGDSCSDPEQCPGDRCVDSRCCNEGCGGTCEACDLSGTEGTCTAHPPYADPDTECSSAPFGCDGDGACTTCGFAPPPTTSCTGNLACDRCDNGTTCVIEADVTGEFDGQPITCPAEFHCRVECSANNACRDAVIQCPDDFDCTIWCGDGGHKCQRAAITCSTRGPCFVDCVGGNTCDDTAVSCGDNACNANCAAGGKPELTCGSSCDCTPC